MNISVYLFGDLGSGYTQYPDDYTQKYFKEFEDKVVANSTLSVRREGQLVYYQYIRRFNDKKSPGHYIGIAFVLNNVLINNFEYLFHIFEGAITNLVIQGEIIKFTDNGEITSNVEKLHKTLPEFQRIAAYLSVQLDSAKNYCEKMPAENYSIGKNAFKQFSVDDDKESILQATKNYSLVFITKNKNYKTHTFVTYSSKLRSLNNRYEESQKVIEELKARILKLQRQKKQTTVVSILAVVIVIITFGLIIFISSLTDKNQKIRQLESCKNDLEVHISSLQKDSTNLENVRQNLWVANENLNKENIRLEKENDELEKENENLNSTINFNATTIAKQKAKIDNLERQLKNQDSKSSNTSYYSSNTQSSSKKSFSGSYYVGASINQTANAYDNSYALWLYADKSVKITSFSIKANKSGNITIGLYGSLGNLISKYQTTVLKNEAVTRYPQNFVIPNAGYYYLAICDNPDNISLSYHSVKGSEYTNYCTGNLQIVGCGKKGRNYEKKYYQYFYNINYSVGN